MEPSTLGETSATNDFSDPLPEIAESICAQFIFDGDTLLKLGETSATWRKIVKDPAIWERLNRARFGPETVPPPATQPVPLPGWRFFPGMDSPGNDIASPRDADGKLDPASLAALADQRDGCAFNTNGWVKRSLLPVARWERFSYDPGAGMYVREQDVVQRLGLPPQAPRPLEPEPEPAVPDHHQQQQQHTQGQQLEQQEQRDAAGGNPLAQPPDLPGWVFYWLMDSPSHDIPHPATNEPHFRSSCTTLEELSQLAAVFPGCVAFNTAGCLKRDVQPQTYWQRIAGPTSWAGLYVRKDVVESRGLLQPVPGAPVSPMLRYFQRSHTRLLAARDVDVTWLNNAYLVRRIDPMPNQPQPQPQPRQQVPQQRGQAEDAEEAPATFETMYRRRAWAPRLWGFGGHGEAAGGGAASGAAGAAEEAGAEASPSAATPPAPPVQVVELRNVCWLNLAGRFYGLGPGRYRSMWWLLVSPDCNVSSLNFRIHATDVRPCGIKPLPPASAAKQADAGGSSTSAAGTSATGSGPVAGSAVGESGIGAGGSWGAGSSAELHIGEELSLRVVSEGELLRHVNGGWYGLECGRFSVPPGQVCDVEVALWNHEGHWKSGLMFKELVLEREDGEEGCAGR